MDMLKLLGRISLTLTVAHRQKIMIGGISMKEYGLEICIHNFNSQRCSAQLLMLCIAQLHTHSLDGACSPQRAHTH